MNLFSIAIFNYKAMTQHTLEIKNNLITNETNVKPTYALEHLATFKLRNEEEIRRPKKKLKSLFELDKSGGIWPLKMYMCFNGQWLVMLDHDLKEIENFPGSLITEPVAFISKDTKEAYDNILVFTVPGVTLANTEMHFFQVSDVSAVHLVEDLKTLSNGELVTVDRNESHIALPKNGKSTQTAKDQHDIALKAAEIAAENNMNEQEQIAKDIQVINHCFEDIECFVTRLQYAAEALKELDLRKYEHNSNGEGLLVTRSRPPTESEFQDILAKHKLALNYIQKLQNHFQNYIDPIHNSFVSLQTIVKVCNDVYYEAKIPKHVVDPLLKRETIVFLESCLDENEIEFWHSLGSNWTIPKDQFKNHKGRFQPIFYDEWSPDWVVDEPVNIKNRKDSRSASPSPLLMPGKNNIWLERLKSRNVKIAEVLYNKTANNHKELDVTVGEYLEVIDDSRKWWKVRNSIGNLGYVPYTILMPYNFDMQSDYTGRETDSPVSSMFDNDMKDQKTKRPVHALTLPIEHQPESQTTVHKSSMPRSISMPAVPVPPPMPPPSANNTPSGTMKRSAVLARNNPDSENEALLLQNTINDELKFTLLQRERRKDLEILITPHIYIHQTSNPEEVEEWLRAKGFSDAIVNKLRSLNGRELFALSPHTLESYFGHNESRRLISQIVLQKNISEYKTLRSSELSAKLAKARQKIEEKDYNPNEVF
ncbi:epidermal growth factor receptor kinase substrate 8 isoform 1-T1 [Glossina fuscipes fuscipes]